jgi:hypothetical protein
LKFNAPVVEGALEPLGAGGSKSVAVDGHEMPGEGANALATHGVALVGHGGGSNLVLLERLLELLEVGEETNVGGDFVGSGAERGEGAEDVNVDLARVGLSSEGVGLGEARELGDESVKLLDLRKCDEGERRSTVGERERGELTLSWSPSKRARKEAWVPVVPLTPRNPMSSRAR